MRVSGEGQEEGGQCSMCSVIRHEDGAVHCGKLGALPVSTLGNFIPSEPEKILQASLLQPLSAVCLGQVPKSRDSFVCLFVLSPV